MAHNTPLYDYSYSHDKALKKIKRASEHSDSDILEEIAEESDPKDRAERDANCQATRMIVDKCLENYGNREYSFKETVNMICEALEEIK